MKLLGKLFGRKAKAAYVLNGLALGELFPRINRYAFEDHVSVPEQIFLFLNEKHIPNLQTESNVNAMRCFLEKPGNEITCVLDSSLESIEAKEFFAELKEFPNINLRVQEFNSEFSCALHCDRYFYFKTDRLLGVSGACIGSASEEAYENIKRVWNKIWSATNTEPVLQAQPA